MSRSMTHRVGSNIFTIKHPHLVPFALLIALYWAGCGSGAEAMPQDESCRQIGYAIANRTFTCGASPEKANERYEQLQSQYSCSAKTGEGFGCAQELLSLSCAQVEQYGDSLSLWLQTSPCSQYFTPNSSPTGSRPSDAADSTTDAVQ